MTFLNYLKNQLDTVKLYKGIIIIIIIIMTTAKEYQRIKTNPEKYNQEKQRISNYIKTRYNSDPEYKQKILERNRQAYQKKKEKKQEILNIEKPI